MAEPSPPPQQQQQQSLEQEKAQLIASLPTLLAGENPESVDKAATALDNKSAAACAGYLRWPDADRRRAVLRLAQESAGASAAAGVPSARTEGTAPTAAAARADAGAPLLPDNAADFVSRIVLDRQTIGTIVRVTKEGLCVTAAHCLVDDGNFLEHASAFGGKLKLIGSSPFHDVIFVQGEPGKAVQLSQQRLQVGQEVCMMGFPLAVDKDLGSKQLPSRTPTATRGQVVAISWLGDALAAADYDGALPNASGGAVLSARGELAGVHVGASYHVDSAYKPEQEEDAPPQEQWDTEPHAMWKGSSAGSQGKRSRQPEPPAQPAQPEQPEQPSVQDVNNLALHAAANIPHKGQLALFVPAAVIGQLGRQKGVLQLSDDLALNQQRHAAHCYRRA